MPVHLYSTYDLGRQPFGLASPAAWLERAGFGVVSHDLSLDPFSMSDLGREDLVGFHLPMHAATRLARPYLERVRAERPECRLFAYGLYSGLNGPWLESLGVEAIFSGEFEGSMVAWATAATGGAGRLPTRAHSTERLEFTVPQRDGLPEPHRYARMVLPDGERRVVATTEASRGCRHLCRHCPVVPVYGGRFRVVPADVVLADIRQQHERGARHVTFADPDFLNGPRHAMEIVRRLNSELPRVTFDATIKVEHLRKHAALLPALREAGCILITTAVESFDDRVLLALDKGHTRGDFVAVLEDTRRLGINLAPTFLAFHPWTTQESYRNFLLQLDELDLVESLPPAQLPLRLLLPMGSGLLEGERLPARVGAFDPGRLVHPWEHADPTVDELQRKVQAHVAAGLRRRASRWEIFEGVWTLSGGSCGAPGKGPGRAVLPAVPYLSEPWFC